jgi:hypothetical protein
MFDLIPHAEIVLTQIRVSDVWLLLGIGATIELVSRLILVYLKVKPALFLEKQQRVQSLSKQVDRMRKMGPSHFVETSKMERQLLAAERELSEIQAARKARYEAAESFVKKRLNYVLFAMVYAAYYSVPIVTLDALAVSNTVGEFVSADTYLKCLLFPVSMIGLGNKVSRWGIPKQVQASSISSLMVMWSAQTTVGMIMDAVEAHILLAN